MLQLSHNEEFVKLQNEGINYNLLGGNIVIVPNVPYLNPNKELKAGTLVIQLTTAGNTLLPPSDHTAHWVGECPSYPDGSEVRGLVNGAQTTNWGNGIVSNYFFSCKPTEYADGKYKSYYEKIKRYLLTISSPAEVLYPEECKKMRKPVIIQEEEIPFVYGDTNSSRAEILGISETMKNQKVAIVGLGGTGAYLLDYLAKCPVAEIHLYDNDFFETHNAFRSPGAASVETLSEHKTKVEYYAEVYGRMKKNIIPHCELITPENVAQLDDMDMVFICVDKVSVRVMIANHLIDNSRPFIDSGLGFDINGAGRITGQVRVTTGVNGQYDHIKDAFGNQEIDDDLYASNIQVAELNSLAAILSILKWKRMLGFYGDAAEDDASFSYNVQGNSIIPFMPANEIEDEQATE